MEIWKGFLDHGLQRYRSGVHDEAELVDFAVIREIWGGVGHVLVLGGYMAIIQLR
jgi:hypothetical protein